MLESTGSYLIWIEPNQTREYACPDSMIIVCSVIGYQLSYLDKITKNILDLQIARARRYHL